MYDLKSDSRVFVAGHRGLLGSAFVKSLRDLGISSILTVERSEVNLLDAGQTLSYLNKIKPDVVINCAARVGGIRANSLFPAQFITENLLIQTNVLEASRLAGATNYVFIGSNCIYPKESEQPIKESALLMGRPEPTNEAYALAKIAGIVQVQSYAKQYGMKCFAAIPCSLFGPQDNFHPDFSHFLPAMILKFHNAKTQKASSVELWGTGKARRELMYSMDAAQGILKLLTVAQSGEVYNLGIGDDLSIQEIAEILAEIIGFEGQFKFKASESDGNLRKLLDSTRSFSLGFKSKWSLVDGITETYKWFQSSKVIRGIANSNIDETTTRGTL